MTDLSSAPLPALSDAEPVRGTRGATPVIFYADLSCPHCAFAYRRLVESEVRFALRHFAIRARHPRAVPLARAAEAARRQGAFWPFVDAVMGDHGRIDDPHVWEKVAALGLDVQQFRVHCASDEVARVVSDEVTAAMRAGVMQTPTIVTGEGLHAGVPEIAWLAGIAAGARESTM